MLPAPWDVKQIRLRIGPFNAHPRQRVDINLLEDLHYTVSTPTDSDPDPIIVPEQRICFGELELNLQIDAAPGKLHSPYFLDSQNAPATTVAGDTNYSPGFTRADGIPSNATNASSVASIPATLPAGHQYSPHLCMRFISESTGNETILDLEPITLPSNGSLQCGTLDSTCISIVNPEGDPPQLEVLSISAAPPIPQCIAAGTSIGFDIHVDSSGRPVDLMKYRIDPPSTEPADACGTETNPGDIELCTSCGPDPVRPILGLNVPSEGGTLQVFAQSGNGCCASLSIPLTPISAAALQCSDDFTVYLHGGETSIPRSDSRITSALDASVSGGCAALTIEDDIPLNFPEGQTTVTFSIEDGPSCTTTVTVER